MAYRDELEAARGENEILATRVAEQQAQLEKQEIKLRKKRIEDVVWGWAPATVMSVVALLLVGLVLALVGALVNSCDAYAVRKAQATSPPNPVITKVVAGKQYAGRLTDAQTDREHFYELGLDREALVVFDFTIEGRCQEGAKLEGYVRGEHTPFLEVPKLYGRTRNAYGAEGIVPLRLPPGVYRFAPVGDPECPMSFVLYTLPSGAEERKEHGIP